MKPPFALTGVKTAKNFLKWLMVFSTFVDHFATRDHFPVEVPTSPEANKA
jgi:hypothetical protein